MSNVTLPAPTPARATKWLGLTALLSLVLLALLPYFLVQIPALAGLSPWLLAIGVFYWALFRPNHFMVSESFALGLLQDILSGTPLGLQAFGMVALHALVAGQRPSVAGWPFLLVWLAFALNSFLVLSLQAGLIALLGATPALWTLLVWLVTLLCFPTVFALLHRLERLSTA